MATLVLPSKIRRYHDLRYFKTPSDHTVIVLPTCSVPLEHLIEENWVNGHEGGFGNRRKITRVNKLRNGKKLERIDMLWVKDPERIFSETPGRLWWAGIRSSEKGTEIENNPRVEEQAKWEARHLIGLFNANIKAEEPQAIIIHADGSKSVITKTRNEKPGEKRETNYDESIRKATRLGALPEDTGAYNMVKDEEGNETIIDTNRWNWKQPTRLRQKGKPQYDSTKYMERLIRELDKLRRDKRGRLIFRNY